VFTLFSNQFCDLGGVIDVGQRVHHFDFGQPITITTNDREYKVDSAVLCAGSWLHELMPNLPIKTVVRL
jgi:glycine/D-amino acid oxidase-like deaminating enzyme